MTVYQIQIQYPNKDGWFPFFESFDTMTQANLRLIALWDSFPKNKFRVVPVAKKV